MLNVLAADIGGTNSRFANLRFDDDGTGELTAEVTFDSQSVGTFSDLVQRLKQSSISTAIAAVDCFVIAMTGPVKRGTYCRSVSLSWDVDLVRDAKSLPDVPTFLINDFLAQAFATLSPIVNGAEVVLPGKSEARAAVGVIGAGTGLGEALLVPDDRGHYIGCPSEGGHQTFAPEDAFDVEFITFACQSFGTPYLEWDDVVSGRGLSMIHLFVSGEKLEPKDIPARFATSEKTLTYFARYYGRACRNFALSALPFGGIYVAGGVAAKNPQIVHSEAFREGFLASKSYREVLESIPVSLFDDEESGLWGAAWYGRERLKAGR